MTNIFTEGEIRLLQRELGVTADGIIGNKTRKAALKFLGKKNIRSVPTLKLLTYVAQKVINVRRTKKQPRIKEDGIFGPITDYRLSVLMRTPRPKEDAVTGLYGTDLILPDRPSWTKDLPTDTRAEMDAYFGVAGTNHSRLRFPYPMYYGNKLVKTTIVNKVAKPHFENLFTRISEVYDSDSIKSLGLDQYSGCYNNRNKRGGTSISVHAYAAGMDIDAPNNRLRTSLKNSRFSSREYQSYWNAVYASGFKSLGLEHNRDVMHIELTK